MIKFRGAYEVISGLQAGYSNNNYTEYGVETSINFPNFLFPFLFVYFMQSLFPLKESLLFRAGSEIARAVLPFLWEISVYDCPDSVFS